MRPDRASSAQLGLAEFQGFGSRPRDVNLGLVLLPRNAWRGHDEGRLGTGCWRLTSCCFVVKTIQKFLDCHTYKDGKVRFFSVTREFALASLLGKDGIETVSICADKNWELCIRGLGESSCDELQDCCRACYKKYTWARQNIMAFYAVSSGSCADRFNLSGSYHFALT